MAFQRMTALETYLKSCAHLANFGEIPEQQAVQMVKEMEQLPKLEFEEGAPLLAMVQQNSLWTPALKETISHAIHHQVRQTMSSKGLVSNRQPLQQFTWCPLYLTKADWDIMLDKRQAVAQKCNVLCERLWKLGMRAPNEDTYAMITVLMLLTETQRFADAVQLRSSYIAVKGLVKGFLKPRLKDDNGKSWYRDLPPCPDALDDQRRLAAFGDSEKLAALPECYTMEFLQQCA